MKILIRVTQLAHINFLLRRQKIYASLRINSSARLAQMVERMTLNHVVAGSIPAVGVNNVGVDSSMVRIRAFQARGPGSIPGRRTRQKIFTVAEYLQ